MVRKKEKGIHMEHEQMHLDAFNDILNIEMEIKMKEKDAKEFVSLLTKYVWNFTHYLKVEQRKDVYFFEAAMLFNYSFFEELVKFKEKMEIKQFKMHVSDVDGIKTEIVNENDDFYFLHKNIDRYSKTWNVEEKTFLEYKNLIFTKKNEVKATFRNRQEILTAEDFLVSLEKAQTSQEFERNLLDFMKIYYLPKDFEVHYEYFDKYSHEKIEESPVSARLISTLSLEEGVGLAFSYGGNIVRSINRQTVQDCMEESKKSPMNIEIAEAAHNAHMQKANLVFGKSIFEDVLISNNYIRSIGNETSFNKTDVKWDTEGFSLSLDYKDEWVSPCEFCVNRLKQKISGCFPCEFKRVD